MRNVGIVVDWGVITLPRDSLLPPRFTAAVKVVPGQSRQEQTVGPLRILIVEDDPALSMMYQVRLEAAGHIVSVVTNGEDCLRQVREDRGYDLVFLDIGLPGMDGLTVLEAMRKSEDIGEMPVVILSNYNEPPMRQRGLSLGALAYLVKSEITPSWLVARIPGWAKG